MSTPGERIAFMVIRGVVALAIVCVGGYCIAQGIHYFALPRLEAEKIQLTLAGASIGASGLGAVIFGAGIAICLVGARTAPRKLQSAVETPERREYDTLSAPSASELERVETDEERSVRLRGLFEREAKRSARRERS